MNFHRKRRKIENTLNEDHVVYMQCNNEINDLLLQYALCYSTEILISIFRDNTFSLHLFNTKLDQNTGVRVCQILHAEHVWIRVSLAWAILIYSAMLLIGFFYYYFQRHEWSCVILGFFKLIGLLNQRFPFPICGNTKTLCELLPKQNAEVLEE